MATLSDLQARREALLKALQSAAQSIRHGDTSVTNRSVAEMKEQLGLLDMQIAELSDTPTVRAIRFFPKDGW